MTLRRMILGLVPTISFVALVSSSGCASGRGGTAANSAPAGPAEGQVITQEQIEKSGAHTVWDALRYTVHNITFGETGRGEPSRITRRGRSSMLLSDGPRILVDGVALTDYTVLTKMPASDLLSIEVLSAMDATTLYGTNYSGGVIRIHTKTGS